MLAKSLLSGAFTGENDGDGWWRRYDPVLPCNLSWVRWLGTKRGVPCEHDQH
jgi:hypothetical protein